LSTSPRIGWRVVEDADRAAVEPAHDRLRPSFDRAGDQVEEVLGALGHVDMGIFLEQHHRGDVLELLAADIGVEIELGADRDIGSDDAPNMGQEIPLGVVIAFRYHRAVQRQQHRIDRQRRLEVGDDLVAETLIHGLHRLAGRLGKGAEALDSLPALGLGQPPPDIERRAEHRHLVAVAALAEEAGFLEQLQAGGQRGEGVGLGPQRGGEDLFHCRSFVDENAGPSIAGFRATQNSNSRNRHIR
jgi:hypothetical protein